MLLSVLLVFLAILFFLNADDNTEGEELYFKYCATCHGDNMEGGNAKSLVDGFWQFGSSDKKIKSNIKKGIFQRGMPSFNEKISENQIEKIIAFLKDEEGETHSRSVADEELAQTLNYDLKVETWLDNLDFPWAISFIDDNHALITEKSGKLLLFKNRAKQPAAVEGIPSVLDEGQGGLMDVAVDPEYRDKSWIYLSYSHAHENGNEKAMTRIVRGKIFNNSWKEQQVIYQSDSEYYSDTRHHYGSRIVFDSKGYLYFSIGDRGDKKRAQDIGRPNGKIHRILPDGTIPEDNPFVSQKNAQPTIFTYGNRNAQGLAVNPLTDKVWAAEHGPMGGDEVNLIKSGINYGWPVVTYGLNYDGTVLSPYTKKPGMESPIFYWRPSIAVCGIDFYTGDLFPRWKNDLIVAALKYEEVHILDIEENRVLHDEVILKGYGRIRDVCSGPDGAIYVVVNEPGKILKLTPVSVKY
jgi:glucose/arabinose dehydrogenase